MPAADKTMIEKYVRPMITTKYRKWLVQKPDPVVAGRRGRKLPICSDPDTSQASMKRLILQAEPHHEIGAIRGRGPTRDRDSLAMLPLTDRQELARRVSRVIPAR